MLNYLLLAVSVFLGAFRSVLTKLVKKGKERNSVIMIRNVVAFFVAFLIILSMGLSDKGGSNVPIILSLLYAVFTLGAQVSLMLAVSSGSVAISSLFYSCGFILPTLFGAIYYNEGITVLSVIGIFLILLSFVLSTTREKNVKVNVKWLVMAISGMLCSGVVGIIQKLFMNEYKNSSLNVFLILAFAFTVVIGSIIIAIFKYGENKKKTCSINNQEKPVSSQSRYVVVILCVVLGVALGLANKLNTYLSGVFPSVISFPVINGGTIFMTTVFSVLLFKERLSTMQKVGLAIGFIAIIITAIGKI